METIKFEQALKKLDQKDIFEETLHKFQLISVEFSKSTLLQMVARDVWVQVLDLSTYWADKDYSQMLLDKTNSMLKDFEELQKNNQLEDVKSILIKCIKRANERIKK